MLNLCKLKFCAATFGVLAASLPVHAQYAAWWHLDENTGQVAADASGNSNAGQLGSTPAADANDPVWTAAGRFNSALVFNGTGNFVQVPDSATLSITGSITLEAWVFPTAVPSQFAPIIVKWNDIDGHFRGYFLTLENIGGAVRPRFDVSHNGLFGGGSCTAVTANTFGCSSSALVRSPASIPLNAWTHLVGVFDSATKQVRLFVNGALSNSVVAVNSNIFDNLEPVLIGSGKLGSDLQDYFAGTIDEPRIWNIPLSDAYVSKLYALQTLTYTKTNTGATSIPISSTVSTPLSYRILIANGGGSSVDVTGFSFWDVLPAEFDLASPPVVAGCSVAATQPPGASHGNQPKLEPEFLQLIPSNPIGVGTSCQVDVAAKTDQNPASAKGNKGPQYEPTACPAGGKILLNEGIQVFDTTLLSSPFVVLGPISPIYLNCAQ
jgi:hypothetical protein